MLRHMLSEFRARRTSRPLRFTLAFAVLAMLATACGGGGSGGGGSARTIEGESYALTAHRRIDRLGGYGMYRAAWKDDDPATHVPANCFTPDEAPYYDPNRRFFRNGNLVVFGMDLGFPTPVRGYPDNPEGRLYFFFGDTDPVDPVWLLTDGVVAKVQSAPVTQTAFGESAHVTGTVNGDSISWCTDTDPSDGLDMAHTLRNTEGSDTQYPTASTGVDGDAFRSTVVRLDTAAGSGPLVPGGSGSQRYAGMGQDFLMGVDVPGGILYLDNRNASDPARRKEYLFNFRWYQPHRVILDGHGVSGETWRADYMQNSFTTIAVSTDLGLHWHACQQRADQWPKPFSGWDPGAKTFLDADWNHPVDGKFINLAFLEVSSSEFGYLPVHDPDPKAVATDGRYVLIFGYGVAHNLRLHLACVPRERWIDLAEAHSTLGATLEGVRYYAGLDADGQPIWKSSEADAVPVCWISHPQIREELEAHCVNHPDPNVRVQIIEESVGGAWTLSVQRVRARFTDRHGRTQSFDRLVAMVDFGYSVLVKDLKTNPDGSTPKTVSIDRLTAADHAAGHQATAQPGPALFTCDPRYPWAWNVKDPTTITAANAATPRPFRPLFLPKAANDRPIVDNPSHDIGDAPGTVCGLRQLLGQPGGPHDDWQARRYDPFDATKTGTEFVGSPFIIGSLA
ncbi:MAG: hypothetical protein D6776_09570, partial [Planctomycetota bacterium]